jgi:hypothetical protein
MLVAQIAYSQLSSVAKHKADALLADLPDVRRSTSHPYDFVTAACWMDDIKISPQYDAFRKLHYIDVPPSGDVRAAEKPNALTALASSRSTLQDANASEEKRAIALVMVMHVVGDIHQPLHCVERDLGGNTFPITGVPGLEPRLRRDGKSVNKKRPATGDNAPVYQRLHAFWDSAYRYDVVSRGDDKSVVLLYSAGRSARPDDERIRQVAAALTARYLPSDKRVLNAHDATQWVLESNHIANNFAFQTPREEQPSNAYFARAHDVACRQIALAGYRLAHLLNAIFKPS